MTLEGRGGIWGRERMGKKWGKNCQCRGEEACAAERGGLGLNKGKLVIVIGAEKETRCLVQRQKNEIKKMEDNTNTQEIRVAIASGPLDSCRIMYEEVFLLAMNLPR